MEKYILVNFFVKNWFGRNWFQNYFLNLRKAYLMHRLMPKHKRGGKGVMIKNVDTNVYTNIVYVCAYYLYKVTLG